MDLKARIQQDMKDAMKAHQALKVSTLRMLIAEMKKREIDKRAPLDEPEIFKTISALIKQRQDSVEAFQKGGRQDLVDKEKEEISILKVYQPSPLSASEIDALVTAAIQETGATGPNDLGKVMKVALAHAAGRAEGKLINEVARAKLSKQST
ncbi:MAG: GatB/YqeY domain-containing protein [Deltaproteobacteria bacterium]|nr:GatB/YqeY domain-containing protein [Deltaproteobacteria bacterium]